MAALKAKLVVVRSQPEPNVSDVRELGTVKDADRIARLRQAIAENRLHIDAFAIADAIVDEE